MKQETYPNRDEWMFARRGKITGSRLAKMYSKRDPEKKLNGFYELIAERLGVPPDDDENAMERGSRLESEAIDRFEQESGKKVARDESGAIEKILWMRDDEENIAISPDGVISPMEACEAKCLKSSLHIKAFLTKQIPEEYREQAVQYFVVNDVLQVLHFIFYDPRFAMFRDPETQKKNSLDFFVIDISREAVQPEVEKYLPYERKMIAEVKQIVNELTF